jgi:hypothetical protein
MANAVINVKAAMNAPRIYKLSKNCLTDNDKYAMVFFNKYIPSTQQIFTVSI